MKFFIPELGSKIILQNSWSFELYLEHRNDSLLRATGVPVWSHDWGRDTLQPIGWSRDGKYGDWHKQYSIPSGTELTIDRIYIRKGLKEFSSVSFFINRKTVTPEFSDFAKRIHNGKGRCRFWAKLADVNNIEFLY